MSIGPLQILIVLLIVVLIFGTRKLRNLGSDLGGAIKSFKKSVSEEDSKETGAAEKMETGNKEEKPKP